MSTISISCPQYYTTYSQYNLNYFNKTILTTVTSNPSIVTNWISNIESFHHNRLENLIVGLDVEWRPSFTRNTRFPCATLQLCVGRRCLIFQLLHAPHIPQSVTDFLYNDNYTFLGVGIHADLKKLAKDYPIDTEYVQAVDLSQLAAYVYEIDGMRRCGLKRLADEVLDVQIEKPQEIRVGRWDNLWLTPGQVMYAALDAIVSFEIGFSLNANEYWFAD